MGTGITYIRTAECRLYLCVVLDIYSKRVVGWSMSNVQDRQMVLKAVLMVVATAAQGFGDPALRSWHPVHEQRMPAVPSGLQPGLQHERGRALRRQRGMRPELTGSSLPIVRRLRRPLP